MNMQHVEEHDKDDVVNRGTSGEDQGGKRRLNVDLEGKALRDFEKLLYDRGLTVTQAVRQGLSLLARFDPSRYQLILRDVRGKEADKEIILI